MGRKMLIFVSDDSEATQQAKSFAEGSGAEFCGYSTSEWRYNLEDPSFRERLVDTVPSLTSGSSVVNSGGATILPFPGQPTAHHVVNTQAQGPSSVKTINELESIAIENAIQKFNGNLTEAAKALGIGRATLYRKVKLYGIKASRERKKIAA